jgi:hypothetical protein
VSAFDSAQQLIEKFQLLLSVFFEEAVEAFVEDGGQVLGD